MNRRDAGLSGENQAAAWLAERGFLILERNFRTRVGEIDIIALDGDVLVFIEVKAWSSYGLEDLGYAVDRKKIHKITESAKIYLSRHREYNNSKVRFDVVFINAEGVRHLAEAFMERV